MLNRSHAPAAVFGGESRCLSTTAPPRGESAERAAVAAREALREPRKCAGEPIISQGTAWLAEDGRNITGFKIGGCVIVGHGVLIGFFWGFVQYANRIEQMRVILTGLAIGRLADGLAQMLQVTAVGWQDCSSASHRRCGFKFK